MNSLPLLFCTLLVLGVCSESNHKVGALCIHHGFSMPPETRFMCGPIEYVR